MTIEEMKQKKREKGYTYAQIAKLSNVPIGTVQKIFNGETESPRYTTILALEKVFKESVSMEIRQTSAYISPVDVQLDNDEKTMVQPDIAIVCNSDQIVTRNICGAPDFVLEVVSPGSRRKDYLMKLYKYQNAGVREFWLVDPHQKVVIVYFFGDETYPVIYPIDAEIPVTIYDGKLVVKLQRIAKWAEGL